MQAACRRHAGGSGQPAALASSRGTHLGDLNGVGVVRDVLVRGPLKRILLGMPAARRGSIEGGTKLGLRAGSRGAGERGKQWTSGAQGSREDQCRGLAPGSHTAFVWAAPAPPPRAPSPPSLPETPPHHPLTSATCSHPSHHAPTTFPVCLALTTVCPLLGTAAPQTCSHTPAPPGQPTGTAHRKNPSTLDSPPQLSRPGLQAAERAQQMGERGIWEVSVAGAALTPQRC
jgi:hypothetical protein